MNAGILVTGANGFVGRVLCTELVRRHYTVSGAVRHESGYETKKYPIVRIEEIGPTTDWKPALQGIDAVIHLAARVHIMQDGARDPLSEFRNINTAGTEQLANSAAACGVRRLVYVSSVKVNGEATHDGRKYNEEDAPCPQDPYGVSKFEAEQALQRVAAKTGLEIVIVRPPLVYGPGVKGNFAQMLKVLAKGIPLPLASVRNLRSLVYVENLVDALIVCATHPGAGGQTYLVSDGEDISTSGLLSRLGDAMGHPSRLFFCPPGLLKLVGQLSGKSDQIGRLLGSLQVDSGKIRRELNWIPSYSLQQGLQATADWYRNENL